MNEFLSTRLIALTLLFILTLGAGLVPVILFRLWNRRKQATILDVSGKGKSSSKITKSTASAVTLQIFMFFGGGVLLATCFVHLIPEVRENFDVYYHSQELSEGSGSSPRSLHSHHHGVHVNHFGGDHKHDHAHDSDHNHNHNHNHNHSHSHSHDDHEATSSEVHVEAANSNESAASSEAYRSPSHGDDALESDESAPYTTGHTHKHKIPYVELAICGGFFLIYFLEEIIHLMIGHDHHGESEEDKDYPIAVSAGDYKGQRSESMSNGKFDSSIDKSTKFGPGDLVGCDKTINGFGYDNHGVDLGGEVCLGKFTPQIDGLSNSSTISPMHSYEMLKMSYSVPTSVKFLRGLVTIIAFSAHSVFDGVAIGLQKTTSQLWTIFFAIFLHKVVVSFAIGLELYEKCESFALTTIHMILFSIMSPIGILLVIVTESEFSERDSPIMIFLSAVATGTILYIVFFEVLQRDRTSKLPGLIQFFFLVAGFACMSCLTLFVDH